MRFDGATRVLPACLALALLAAACSGSGDAPPGVAGATPSPGGDAALPQGVPNVSGWNTDWTKSTIELSELRRGLAASDPRDGIPPIDQPKFETVEEASEWLDDREPVVLMELNGEARAYPLRILTWHEIVNDEFVETPVAVTYCPLCNSAVAFDRRVHGRTLRFGVSGLLRHSDLVMWDRETESLWQQITGEAIVGELAGTRLELIAAPMVAWREFRKAFPDGRVLSRDTGFTRDYGANPYFAYDRSDRPFLFSGEIDPRYPAMERVAGVVVDGESKAYPFSVISEERAVNDEVAGRPIAVLWGAAETASALDTASIPEGRAVGTGVAYFRSAGDRVLTLKPDGEDRFRDEETGSTWDILGRAVDGPLKGTVLEPVVHTNHLWFAWAAFNTGAPVYEGRDG